MDPRTCNSIIHSGRAKNTRPRPVSGPPKAAAITAANRQSNLIASGTGQATVNRKSRLPLQIQRPDCDVRVQPFVSSSQRRNRGAGFQFGITGRDVWDGSRGVVSINPTDSAIR